MLNLSNQRWQKVTDGIKGNDLAWSGDSRFLYASNPIGDRPEIIRIDIENANVEPAVDSSSLSKLAGNINTWSGITPDGDIILKRLWGADEIFALNYTEK